MSLMERAGARLARLPGWAQSSAALVLLALAWRLWLMPRYYGWEESDYGNLAMARGVLESGFTHYDMNHLPLYYGLSAAVLAVVGDTVLATHLVSLVAGLAVVALVVVVSWRLAGREAAWVAGLLVVFQPELALYSASALREPLYAALLMGALAALGRERLALASALSVGAFLVRFDALAIMGPVLAVHALGRPHRPRRLVAVLAPLVVGVVLWSLYCHVVHGLWRFWEHSVTVNIETGLGEEAGGRLEWMGNGARVSLALALEVLPAHLGSFLPLLALPALPGMLRSGHGLRRSLAVLLVLITGFWLAIGFTGQHDPGHNLYWKWLLPLVPFWGLAAGLGAHWLLSWRRRLPQWALLAVLALGLLWTWGQQLDETRRQLAVSEELYKPQLSLAKRIERDIPETVPMILDNIPACWLGRRSHQRTLWTWMDIPVPEGGREDLGAWMQAEGIRYVLWFQEEWTQAPVVAPWLATGGSQRLGPVNLTELEREDGYGWIWYRVDPWPPPKPSSR
jgi:hypothetical protein